MTFCFQFANNKLYYCQQNYLFYVKIKTACICLTFSLGYKSTTREKGKLEVGGGGSVGGCREGSSGRKIKRKDREVNKFKRKECES